MVLKASSTSEVKTYDPAPSNQLKGQGQTVSAPPVDSKLFIAGVVHAWQADTGTVQVMMSDSDMVEPALWVAGSVFAGLFGLKVLHHPEPGTEVLVLRADGVNENYVIGTTPTNPGNTRGTTDEGGTATISDGLDYSNVPQQPRADQFMRKDRAPGETDMMNSYGVGLSFLQNLVRLRASEASMLEMHLIDDLVRLVSSNFQHVSAFGDFKILNDGGRPSVIWRGSSKLHETEGRETPLGSELPDVQPYEEAARTRFEAYIGHLGNIVHLFVKEPAKAIGDLSAGRFRLHVNEDGSILMQSVADIIIEKVVRIQVPAEKFVAADPQGDKLSELQYQPDPTLKTWLVEDAQNIYYESYKLRDYARWMNNWFSLAQYHRSKKDYTVPTEAESPVPTIDNGGDVERPNSGLQTAHNLYIQTYATIRIFRDGTVLLMDGYGSTVHMTGGNISISATKDLNLESAGNVSITAGKDLTLKAYRHIDLQAATGGITQRARTWYRSVVERGSMVLESLARADDLEDDETAITVRTRTGSMRLLAGANLILQGTMGVMVKSVLGLLVRASSLLVQRDDQNATPIFAVNSVGAVAATSLSVNNFVACEQVQVRRARPIQTMLGPQESGVLVGEGVPTSTIYTDAQNNNQNSIDLAGEPQLFPNSAAILFKHHDNYGVNPLLRSITQTMLYEGSVPVTLDPSQYERDFNTSVLKGGINAGVIAPGDNAQHLVYNASNPPMHLPSVRNNQPNKGTGLTSTSWTFTRHK